MPATRVDSAPAGVRRPSRQAAVERAVLPFPIVGPADRTSGQHSSVLWLALQDASAAAAASLGQSLASRGVTRADIDASLAVLCECVRHAVRERAPHVRDLPSRIPARQCLEALRRGFLANVRRASDDGDREALLDVLDAFDRVQDALDADCAQRVMTQLTGPAALDLLVEVVHDMRSPLGSVLFLVETLRKSQSGPINAVQERQLGIVYNAAFGLSALTNDLTEMARGCDRMVDPRPLPFSIAEVARTVGEIVQPIAEEKRLALTIDSPPASFRLGHPAALHRVLLNLTTNALKFTNEGGVKICAREKGRSAVEFSVTDTGKGIPPDVAETLFDAFRCRAQPGQVAFSSAGLGLAICRKLTEAMGSELRVEAAPERGTRFVFELELPVATTY